MDTAALKAYWLSEERARFAGWDFTYLAGRTESSPMPWSYRDTVVSYLRETTDLLDMGTGGGEFLLSLSPPPGRTFATEAYPPNVALAHERLAPHGIEVRRIVSDAELPFPDGCFDLIMNRHESFDAGEVARLLKPGGVFVTQQVGGANNRGLSDFLLDGRASLIDPSFNLEMASNAIADSGLKVLEGKECFPRKTFKDVGALVYFAKVIEWEFPGFSVERCFDKLLQLHAAAERGHGIESREHRFLIVAKK